MILVLTHINTIFLSLSIFQPASSQADHIATLTNYFIVAAAFILLVVTGLLIYVILRFKAKPGDAEPRQVRRNKKVEAVMIGVPFLMVAGFFIYTINVMQEVHPPAGNQVPDVIVTGHQWWWEASYPGTGAVTANEIHLPVHKKVLLQFSSSDVIHDWWVPELGPKMDMMPGRKTHLWLTINEPGVYEGACSEFCGEQHAWMRIRVVAQRQDEYERWLQQKSQPAQEPQHPLALKGEAIFNLATCGNCHTIRGTAAQGQSGPDLTHFASRTEMLAGMMPTTEDNLRDWLTDPQQVKPGAHMPRFIFEQDSINALVAYISGLK
ncbi:cytochrome c oxidase subunit II [Pontibacter sp. 172403-2]|uniref:cytochrome c oxidase subunit II n=1 Tax=Pontibacter rufus TaxID=2791028 RepID=UPI0018AF9908|nr:cytochrome c oxidase subunit II [Pontibacter sp. 172403-2]MBF9254048.1 cytochrome c oxidase subunit II [Pontibacter sp. 172403-2]